MAYTIKRAADYPDIKAQKSIPELYEKVLQKRLRAETCLPRIAGSEFMGQLKLKGDTVYVTRAPLVTVHDHVRGGKITIETAPTDYIKLEVNRALDWNYFIDDIDAHQSPQDLLGAAQDEALAIISRTMETQFFTEALALADAHNVGKTAGVISQAYDLGTALAPQDISHNNSVAFLTQLFAVMAEQNISFADGVKSVVVPEWYRWMLINSGLADASKMGQRSSLLTNEVANIGGLTIYSSSLLPKVGDAWPIFACTKASVNFVVALNKTKMTEPSDMHGTLVKGVCLYDWGCVRPEGIAVGYATPNDTSILTANPS